LCADFFFAGRLAHPVMSGRIPIFLLLLFFFCSIFGYAARRIDGNLQKNGKIEIYVLDCIVQS
jgi:hypothetical protein